METPKFIDVLPFAQYFLNTRDKINLISTNWEIRFSFDIPASPRTSRNRKIPRLFLHPNDEQRIENWHIDVTNLRFFPNGVYRNIRSIKFDEEFNFSLVPLTRFPNLKCLYLGKKFNRDIDILASCGGIEKIIFGEKFNQKLPFLDLTYLHANYKFSRDIKLLGNTLKELIFGEDFDKDISSLGSCPNLSKLVFGKKFNQSIASLANCSKLKKLTFGENFNRKINVLKHCEELKYLSFGENFDQSIAVLLALPNLKYFKITDCIGLDLSPISICSELVYLYGGRGHMPKNILSKLPNLVGLVLPGLRGEYKINELLVCKNLRYLDFGAMFNEPIDILAELQNLEEVIFGWMFNQPINALGKCKKIQFVVLADNFNHTLLPLRSCKELKYLEVDYRCYSRKNFQRMNICPQLKFIHIRMPDKKLEAVSRKTYLCGIL